MAVNAVKRAFGALAALFLLIFICRAAYDLLTFDNADIVENYNIYYSGENAGMSVRNYASLKVDVQPGGAGGAGPAAFDQKYEKIANISTKTLRYDADMERVGAVLTENRAVVQMENSRGLAGSRRVDMIVGVRPESFDAVKSALQNIGRITSTSTVINDKTYEYRQMMADKETLERRKASYAELRKLGGGIPEMLQLEDKIIEVESQIQQQLIGLGEYSDENALCTINFSMYEGSEAGFGRKIWNALKWSASVYAAIIGMLILTALAAFIMIAIWNYIKKSLLKSEQKAIQDVPANAAETRGGEAEPKRNGDDVGGDKV